jgi:hypothetical protein
MRPKLFIDTEGDDLVITAAWRQPAAVAIANKEELFDGADAAPRPDERGPVRTDVSRTGVAHSIATERYRRLSCQHCGSPRPAAAKFPALLGRACMTRRRSSGNSVRAIRMITTSRRVQATARRLLQRELSAPRFILGAVVRSRRPNLKLIAGVTARIAQRRLLLRRRHSAGGMRHRCPT